MDYDAKYAITTKTSPRLADTHDNEDSQQVTKIITALVFTAALGVLGWAIYSRLAPAAGDQAPVAGTPLATPVATKPAFQRALRALSDATGNGANGGRVVVVDVAQIISVWGATGEAKALDSDAFSANIRRTMQLLSESGAIVLDPRYALAFPGATDYTAVVAEELGVALGKSQGTSYVPPAAGSIGGVPLAVPAVAPEASAPKVVPTQPATKLRDDLD